MLACLAVASRASSPWPQDSLPGRGWYAGAEGGVPFAVSSFSSFAGGNVRAGWSAGVFAGFAFSRSVSLEAQASWGRAGLGSRPCCDATGYWLGADGSVYHAPAAGLQGWDYRSLKSRVALQGYGVQLNINVLPWLGAPPTGRWSLEISPRVAAVSTKARLYDMATGGEVAAKPTRWHFAAGFRLQGSCAVAGNIRLGVYTGMAFLTGKPLDGIPRLTHSSNFLWESGARLSFRFGKKKRKPSVRSSTAPLTPVKPAPLPRPAEEKQAPVEEEPSLVEEKAAPATPEPEKTAAKEAVFPVIYFDFNSVRVRRSELAKVDSIARMMAADPSARVRLTGWCDRRGAASVNLRVSLLRAEEVKRLLVALGVDASRVEADGKGVDHGQPDAALARRVATVIIKEEGL